MINKFSTILAATVLGLSLTVGVASAGAVDDAIKARKACMKANGGAMGTFVPMMQGAKPFDAAAVAAAVTTIETACAGWANWWAPETAKGEAEATKAKAEIWSDAAGFTAASAAYSAALAAVKGATDDASFKTAFGGFGGSCKGCHEAYRAADE
jgi:cytochrome c556